MEVDISLVLGFAGTIIAAASLFIAKMGDARKLEHRLTAIEEKINPIWDAIIGELPKLLIKKETQELDELLLKFTSKNNSLTYEEKLRLTELLNEEHQKAVETKDAGRGLAITLLRAAVKVTKI